MLLGGAPSLDQRLLIVESLPAGETSVRVFASGTPVAGARPRLP
jgi:hypothetical protein